MTDIATQVLKDVRRHLRRNLSPDARAEQLMVAEFTVVKTLAAVAAADRAKKAKKTTSTKGAGK